MQFAFDLISDLHVDTWDPAYQWICAPTSPVCVVAGDVARDRKSLLETLRRLGECYRAVFYIDGNDEHRNYINGLDSNYDFLSQELEKIPNIVYLQNNVVVVEGVAIVGTNGWWAFDFANSVDSNDAVAWYQDKHNYSDAVIASISQQAVSDAMYMSSSIKRLQTHRDVKKIVVVTHTVPDPDLIAHDVTLIEKPALNTMGNRYMMQALAVDTEHKIDTWCFGHYHNSIDQTRGGVRFVNNCRGRGDTPYKNYVYHPKRIVIDY